LPYLTQPRLVGHVDQLVDYKHDNEKNLEAAYKYMISRGFLAPATDANGRKVPGIKPLLTEDNEKNVNAIATSTQEVGANRAIPYVHSKSF
jgi:hypothetical protein